MLFALLLPLFLGMGALAVDVGYWYVVKKKAQDAADAAALAAARDLDKGKAVATQTAIDYVHANMPDAPTPSVEFPYIPDDASSGAGGGGTPDYTKIEVTVSHSTGTFFGRVFGLISADGRRGERSRSDFRAVVSRSTPTSTECVEDAVVLKGDNQQIRGHRPLGRNLRGPGPRFVHDHGHVPGR